MLHDGEALIRYRLNERRAGAELCWENEAGKFEELVKKAMSTY
jgi:hypothetical protein